MVAPTTMRKKLVFSTRRLNRLNWRTGRPMRPPEMMPSASRSTPKPMLPKKTLAVMMLFTTTSSRKFMRLLELSEKPALQKADTA